MDGGRTPAAGFRWVLGALAPRRGGLALVAATSLVMTAAALAQPWLTGRLIDRGLLAGDANALFAIAALMLALALAASLLGLVNRWLYLQLSAGVLFHLREAVFGHLQRLSPAALAARGGGECLARLDGDVAELQRFAVDAPLAALNAALGLAGCLFMLLLIDPVLTLVAFVLLPGELAVLRAVRPALERATRRVREQQAGVVGFISDRLAAMKFIQSVNAGAAEIGRLRTLNSGLLGGLQRQQIVGYLATGVPALLVTASTALVFVLGGLKVIDGAMTLGALIAFTAYLARAGGPLQTAFGLYTGLTRARVSLVRVLELMDLPAAVVEASHPRPLPHPVAGELRFEAVSFRHRQAPVLDRVDLHIPAGTCIGFTGPSGTGKSTLADLLHRHYDPDAGRILLDDIDLRDLALADLRRVIAVVAQDTVILAGSVAENLRFVAPDADEAALRAALHAAHLDRWLARLPGGLDTPVGWRGMALSGGERQRLAIARALLQQPRILVLDEATSGLDTPTERAVLDALHALFTGCTRLIISHRGETLATCERVYHLRDGCLAPEPDPGARQWA